MGSKGVGSKGAASLEAAASVKASVEGARSSQRPSSQRPPSQETSSQRPSAEGAPSHGPSSEGELSHGPSWEGALSHGPSWEGAPSQGLSSQGPSLHGTSAEADSSPSIDRRLFISRTVAAVAGVGALATVGYGVRTALGDPVIEPVAIHLAKLDPRMSGLKIAVVSDIHLGPLNGLAHTERIVRMINGLRPDLVAIVGDLVDGTVAELGPLARPLGDLQAPSYFVTGNHEYYTANGPLEWEQELNGLGVRSLRNERVEISRGGAVLDLAGVNDISGGASGDGPDLGRALGGRDQSRPVVLLAHQPVYVKEAAAHGVDLQLSGHTHGGQMAPFNLVVKLQQPVVAGLATIDGTQVYVTRGAGFWGPPVRVGAPPEITLMELLA
ncbi:metallophosphoesterase [Streptosporangiaceae bacterium NEAU-GS5]|nr:metallophosphoesterase [Streptosporangiaceae bacterium NEAU-GS5]